MARRGVERRVGSLALRVKLLVASVLVEVVMLGLLVGNSVRLIGQHMEQQLAARIQAIELAYKTALAPALAARDYATLRDILDGWRAAEDVAYLVVSDKDGRLLAASGLEQSTPPSMEDETNQLRHVRFAVDYLGQTYGYVQYGLSMRFIHQAKASLLTQSALIALTEVLITVLLLSLIGFWLTRHLSELMHASERVAAGDYDFRLRESARDEVGRLARLFNRMADAVRERVAALREGEQRFRAIADYTYAWENWFAPHGALRWVNPAVERVTGYTPVECHAMSDFPLPLVFGDDVGLVRQCHALGLSGQTGQDREFRIRRKDGHVIWVAMSWQPIFDDAGAPLGYRSSVRDISLEHRTREELAYQASHDALTGLFNRRVFEARLAEALAAVEQGGEARALLYIDLDQFKLVNDTCGHSAGDRLLQEIAAIMRRNTGDGVLARLGGDEFGLLLQADVHEARRRAERLIDAINGHVFSYEGRFFQLGASTGVVAIQAQQRPEGYPRDIDALLIAADQACYAAKDKGRNRVEVYAFDDAYYQSQRAQFLSVAQIAAALREGRLVLLFQRVEPLRVGLRGHVEVLLRLQGENGQLVSPGVFIPAAERFNLMPQVDRWVVDEVCRVIGRGLGALPPDTVYAVNLSGVTLSADDLADYVANCVTRHAAAPARLCFEITETAAIGNFDRAQAFIRRVRDMGATVALDDFGAGLSSFAYLRRLEVDFLKIDALFVRNLHQDARDRAVVKSIMEVARVHGMHTIAEFVHTAEIAAILRDMGVDYAQGYALHPPERLLRPED